MSIKPLTLVLQGEYAVIEREGGIETSTPTSCHVVTVYHKDSQKAFLTHIDDYTSVPDTIQKIMNQFETLRPLEIKVFGGGADFYSKHQFKQISSILDALNLPFEKVQLKKAVDRPQISMDGETGKIRLIERKERNEMLELIQREEYRKFNRLLDQNYPGKKGTDIPNCEVKLAVRQTPIKSNELPLLPKRSHLAKDREERQILLQLLEKILQQQAAPRSMQAFRENNFNFLTRLACSRSEDLPLLSFLLTYKSVFKIDLEDRGKTSGTAFDVAKRMNNIQAVELLEKSKITPLLDTVQQHLESQVGEYDFPDELVSPQIDEDWDLLFIRVSANPRYVNSFKLLRNHMNLFKIDIQTALHRAISEFAPALGQNAEDCALLFRKSAQKPAYLPLLYFLGNNRDLLHLDIHARGKTSGSALDVATKANNISAIAFLEKLGKPSPMN